MRKIVFILLFFTAKYSFCQLAVDFTDDSFKWSGSNAGTDFRIEDGRLRSNSGVLNSSFYMSLPNTLAMNCMWEFWCNLKFNTSSANYTDVYLISDKEDLKSSNINGYFIRIGGTEDEVSLYRRSGGLSSAVEIIDGLNGVTGTTNNQLKIRVTRDEAGIFTLAWDLTGKGLTYVEGGSAADLTFINTGWFGIYIQQSTASFINKHYFDDIRIAQLVKDTAPPQPVKAVVTDSLHVDVYFNEVIRSAEALDTGNYMLSNGYARPQTVTATAASSAYSLTFAKALETGNYVLTVNNIADLNGNAMVADQQFTFIFIRPFIARYGDLVINELLADPAPSAGLPEGEFVEIWNTTSEYILLEGWKYGDQSNTYAFGADTIGPDQYIILCASADEASYRSYGKTLGLKSWPVLNNDKDMLRLVSPQEIVIDQVSYRDTWYKDALKKQGGYSLERIDPDNICTGIQNWTASNAVSGGSPGRRNTVYKTQQSAEKPRLAGAVLKDSVTIVLEFSKYIDSTSATAVNRYSINNGVGNPEKALPQAPGFTTVMLTLKAPLKRGLEHVLTISNLRDCAGNEIDAEAREAKFFNAESIRPGDILISEVLFNPGPGGVDFVEIYNNTDHVLDLKELQLSNTDTAGNIPERISEVSLYIPPSAYRILTANPQAIQENYHFTDPVNFVETGMPAFKASAGTVILISNAMTIDRFDYTEAMHIPLLKEAKGVSLERALFKKAANDPGNFTSASAVAGYATPGYKNSVSEGMMSGNKPFLISSKIFSPDGDGSDDQLELTYHFKSAGKMGTLNIYNDKGIVQRRLIKNQNLPVAGSLCWDGLNDSGNLCRVGIYIVCFEVFDFKGRVQTFKESVVLAAKLN